MRYSEQWDSFLDRIDPEGASARRRKRISRSAEPSGSHGKGHRIAWITPIVVLALVLVLMLCANFITEVMWYAQAGYASVIWTQLGIKVGV